MTRGCDFINELNTKGCITCYESAYNDRKKLNHITESKTLQTTLYQCPKCGSYWEFISNSGRIISEDEIRALYDIKITKFYRGKTYIKIIFTIIYIFGFYYAWYKSSIIAGLISLLSLIFSFTPKLFE